MPALSEYTNVYDTAVEILRQKGYQVWRDETGAEFYAERSGWDFTADSVVGLLGLVTIFESVNPTDWKEYWWRTETLTSGYRLLETHPETPYVSVAARPRPV